MIGYTKSYEFSDKVLTAFATLVSDIYVALFFGRY